MGNVKCKGCGKSVRRGSKFCSLPCYYTNAKRAYTRTRIKKKCATCGSAFYVPPYRDGSARYCSKKCGSVSLQLPQVKEARLKATVGRIPENKLSPTLRKARDAFFDQRYGAFCRGIGWELTFDQWWSIWQASNHWEDRGRGFGKYQMARFGDLGPYAATNVRIVSLADNLAERNPKKWTGERNGLAKLTVKEVRKIRALEGKKRRPAIAAEFGISVYTVEDIQKRRTWKHVE